MTRKLALALLLSLVLSSQARAVDIQKLTQEGQRTSQASQQFTLVWWMPQAWWEATLNNSAALTPEGRAQVLSALDDYMIFAISRVKVGLALDPRSKAEMLANAKLEVDGKTIEPLSPDAISPAGQMLLSQFKPMMGNMLGKIGQGIEFVVYPAKQGDRVLVDPRKPGGFKYTLYDQTFTWRTPLPSLLPLKSDPKTGDDFPGDYNFNPYTGDPLHVK